MAVAIVAYEDYFQLIESLGEIHTNSQLYFTITLHLCLHIKTMNLTSIPVSTAKLPFSEKEKSRWFFVDSNKY